jgi:integrase
MRKPTRPRRSDKPKKPYPEFPLYPHATRRWAKKIRGKTRFFGPWEDWQGALARYQEQREDLYAGRVPRAKRQGYSVRQLCNEYLHAKKVKADRGQLSLLSWKERLKVCELLTAAMGDVFVDDVGPADFAAFDRSLPVHWGLHRRGKVVTIVRCVFRYAMEMDITLKLIKFGPDFKPAGKQALKAARDKRPVRHFSAAEVLQLLASADVHMKAMILLGVNCGYGNTDISGLQKRHLDLAGGWAEMPRQKTCVDRRCPLWPETVAAVKASLAERPEPLNPDYADHVFLGPGRTPLVRVREESSADGKCNILYYDRLHGPFSLLMNRLEMRRAGRGFYSLRHSHRTASDASKDQPACNLIMGHDDGSMAGNYRHGVDDERLRAVARVVHDWLFGPVVLKLAASS